MEFTGATLDSRQVRPGMLFVAIKGEKVDGHDFIPQALEQGAAGIVDGREELARVAAEYRRSLKAVVIGVTGSAGKTTTKEFVAAMLRAGGFKVHATEGNFNNDLGMPLTILNCPKDADFLVVEMGTNHPGEIKYLVDIARPNVGLISSIGTAHIEFFKTREGIAEEKGTLLANLAGETSFGVLARENDFFEQLSGMCSAPVVAVSLQDEVTARVREAIRYTLPGAHNVSNALIAMGCAMRLGVDEAACLEALKAVRLPGGRWRVVKKNGVTYIDDTYNANPTSMIAALETFMSIEVPKGRHVAVLGDMFELGEKEAELHEAVGRRVVELHPDCVLVVGPKSCLHIGSLVEGAHGALTLEGAKSQLPSLVREGDLVLIKASHGMNLCKLLED